MNKTITANIGGFVFNIEEQAYESLRHYLNAVRASLGSEECIDEIMQDIEHRIAELFREMLHKQLKEVIDGANVKEVISTMGEPADYSTGSTASETSGSSAMEEPANKQFYRDPDDAMLGGVCSGISAYFGWDPLFLRILFVILAIGFGTGFVLYIILWIIIPEARTTSEKLRMRGKKVDVETIKSRFNDFKKDVEHLATPEGQRKMHRASARFADSLSETAKNFYTIFGKAIGGVMLILALFFLVILIRALLSGGFVFTLTENGFTDFDYSAFGNAFFGNSTSTNLVYLSVLTLLLVPVVGFLMGAIRLLFNTRIKFKPLSIGMSVLSSLAFITLIVIGSITGSDFAKENTQETSIVLSTNSDTLYIDSNTDIHFSDDFDDHHEAFFELLKIEEKTITFGYPIVDVVPSSDTNFRINIIRTAHGSNQSEAIRRAKNINYNYSVSDSLVKFDPYFVCPAADMIRAQQIRVEIGVPLNKSIRLSRKADRIIYNIQNEEDLEDEKMPEIVWTMKEKGLSRR